MLDWFRFLRLAGVITVLANALAAVGALALSDGTSVSWLFQRLWLEPSRVAWVLLASCCAYAAGMAWNDIVDAERDRIHRPQRPVASGRIGLTSATIAAVLLTIAALASAAMVPGGFFAMGVVLMLALIYDFGGKEVPWLSSVLLGAVRAAHAVFALLAIGGDWFQQGLIGGGGGPWPFAYPAIIGAYVLGLAVVAEAEDRSARRWELLLGGALMGGAVLAALLRTGTAPWLLSDLTGGGGVALATCSILLALLITVLLAVLVGRPWLHVVRGGRRSDAGAATGAALGGMILLDALVLAGTNPALALIPLLLLYPLFRLLSAIGRMD